MELSPMVRSFDSAVRLTRILALVVGKLALISTPTLGYPTPVDFNGKLLRWDISPDNPTVTYGIDAENPDDATYYQPVVEQAIELWNAAPGSYFRFKYVTLDENPQVTLYLRSNLTGVRDTAGYTLFDQYDNEKPKHCSIYIQVDQTIADYWMAKIFLHELGHAAGLGHSLVPNAIMSYSLDVNSFALDTDDDAAISHSYPANGDSPSRPVGCSVGASHNSQPPNALGLLLVMALPALVSLWPTCGRWRLSRGS